jgi:hypothetical protein
LGSPASPTSSGIVGKGGLTPPFLNPGGVTSQNVPDFGAASVKSGIPATSASRLTIESFVCASTMLAANSETKKRPTIKFFIF